MRISDWSSDVCSSDLYEACFYRTPTGDYGFPTIGLKAAMVGACRFVDMKMTEARGAFHIDGEMLPVQGEPRPREDMVRVGMGPAEFHYRPAFHTGSTLAATRFNTRCLRSEP